MANLQNRWCVILRMRGFGDRWLASAQDTKSICVASPRPPSPTKIAAKHDGTFPPPASLYFPATPRRKPRGWKASVPSNLVLAVSSRDRCILPLFLSSATLQNGLGAPTEYQAKAQRSSRCHRIHSISPTLLQRSSSAQIAHSSLTQALSTKRLCPGKTFETPPRTRI